ncbi:MAG: OmpA family protein [Kofleriaceae bacterium]|nr:OmpA family protein [Kofleriaceae bacterium]
MTHDVGDHTALVDSGRHAPRRGRLAWVLLTIVMVGGGTAGWWLWERGELAGDEAADVRDRLTAANQRAATAESRILELTAGALRAADAPPPPPDDDELVVLAEQLRAALGDLAGVAIDDAATRLTVQLDDPQLFRGDDDVLTPRGRKLIDDVGGVLADAGDRPVWIHGHVDDTPLPDDAVFETAWELSSARALAVLRRLVDQDGVPERRLAAVAFGDQRPVSSADRRKNARIEIVIERGALAAASARTAPARSR